MPKKTTKKKIVAPPSSMYRRIAVTFVVAAVVLLGVVLYFALTRVTIVIKPKKEPLTAMLAVTVRPQPEATNGEVKGMVKEVTIEKTQKFPVTGDGQTVDTKTTGSVIIKNTTSHNQPLVKTTRLLSTSGILFRITESVTVPAGGEVNVGVTADQSGKSGEIGPTKFTIPGLWEGLQDKIYAVSSDSMCCGTEMRRVVTADDISTAEKGMEAQLLEDTKIDLRKGISDGLGGEVFASTVVSEKVNVEPGTEQSDFSVTVKLKVTAVFYDKVAIESLAQETLRNLAGAERELVELDPARIVITIDRYDLSTTSARLSVNATGLLVLRPGTTLFDKDHLVGLDRQAATAYFKAFSAVDSVVIQFRPPWLKKIPSFKDHIEIKIEE